MTDKTLLRKELLEKRRNISLLLRHAKSRKILRKLSLEPEFRRAEHVALYYGIVPEVETRFLLKKVLKDKKLYLPAVAPKKSLMLRQVRSLSRDLKQGAYNIMEPKASCKKRSADRMDIFIVPGVAFDKTGGRMGRGGGYYDRLLRKAKKVIKVGLCFREQIVEKVPMKAHDVRMDQIITD